MKVEVSPQEVAGCACVPWSIALKCADHRFGRTTGLDGRAMQCTCVCHDRMCDHCGEEWSACVCDENEDADTEEYDG